MVTKKTFCHLNKVPVYQKSIVDPKVGQNLVVDSKHPPDSKEVQPVLFHKCSAEVYRGHHYHNKRGIVTHKAPHPICKATQLERSFFCYWATVVSYNPHHQQRSLNPSDIFGILMGAQPLKPWLII